ncbi:MAG: TPM domain-containing protein [Chitinophagaceae bacterium]|nr:TPM domain-containing protein [Chitinophagaceae bacterium]
MKKFFSIIALLLLSVLAFSQESFDLDKLLKEKPTKLVIDFTGTLTPDQAQALENKLVAFDDSTSTQIAVVIVPSINGKDIADFNIDLGRAWGVGGKENNNGIVLLIAKNDRKLNIATGYGLEGALPDLTAKQIIDDIILPNFKGDDYYRGIEEGTDAIIQAVKGEYKAPANYNKGKKGSGGIGRIIFIIVMIVIFLAVSGGKGGGGSFMSRRGFAAWTIGSMLNSGGSGGGWSGGGGSSGGGGFGGFGGGSFGGGGSSGSW